MVNLGKRFYSFCVGVFNFAYYTHQLIIGKRNPLTLFTLHHSIYHLSVMTPDYLYFPLTLVL